MTRCAHALRIEHCPPCTARTLVNDLAAAADWLAASLMPGTGRTWQPPAHYEDRRTPQQVEQARLEREQRIDIAPGESPAPYDLDVADLLSEILTLGDTLAEQLVADVEPRLAAWAGTWADHATTMRLPDAPSAYADPRPYLTLAADLLDHADLDLVEHVADQCWRLLDRTHRTLGLVMDGQLLDGHCPWCTGRTSRHPEGGRRTLRVHMSTDDEPRPLIVCEGGHCEPGANSGIRWRGLPAWDLLNEGDWLGQCIRVREGGAPTCRCGLPVLRTGKPGRPAVHCSEKCRRDADAERQRKAREEQVA